MSEDGRLAEVAGRLTEVAEDLADLALDRLRTAADPHDPDSSRAQAEERRITRARRAVEKAAALLGAASGDDGS